MSSPNDVERETTLLSQAIATGRRELSNLWKYHSTAVAYGCQFGTIASAFTVFHHLDNRIRLKTRVPLLFVAGHALRWFGVGFQFAVITWGTGDLINYMSSNKISQQVGTSAGVGLYLLLQSSPHDPFLMRVGVPFLCAAALAYYQTKKFE